jgi:hypothetical protein
MTPSRITTRAAAILPLAGIALALANWYAQPDIPWAWALAIVMCLVMIAVLRFWQRAARRVPGGTSLVRGVAEVRTGVIYGGLILVIALAARLAQTYGFVDQANSSQRTLMVIIGAYLAVLGNAMPKRLPPVTVMQEHSARIQAFQRMAAWTWVLGGLGFAAAWAFLPLAATGPVSTTIVVAAIAVTVVQLFRVRKVCVHAPHVSRS